MHYTVQAASAQHYGESSNNDTEDVQTQTRRQNDQNCINMLLTHIDDCEFLQRNQNCIGQENTRDAGKGTRAIQQTYTQTC